MLSLEQVKLLESKIVRAIDFVNQITEENTRLKKRNGELEASIARLKEEKVKVEEGFSSAMGRLNQFEDAIERSLSAIKEIAPAQQAVPVQMTVQAQMAPVQAASAQQAVPVPQAAVVHQDPPVQPAAAQVQPIPPPQTPVQPLSQQPLVQQPEAAVPQPGPAQEAGPTIPSAYVVDEEPEDIPEQDDEEVEENSGEAELDIF